MPGTVITVDRRQKLGWLSRLHLPSVVRALASTSRSFARNLAALASEGREGGVVQVPEERVDHPEAFRGMPVLVALADGSPRCVGCGLCEFACPADCIEVVAAELESGERAPAVFDIDMGRCMFCGLCEEACPEEAIVMSREVEISTFDRESMRFQKEQLLVPESLLKRRLDFLRSEYEREDARAPRKDT